MRSTRRGGELLGRSPNRQHPRNATIVYFEEIEETDIRTVVKGDFLV